MNIYLLKFTFQGYECYEGFVVAAHTHEEAKEIIKAYMIDAMAENESDCFENDIDVFIVIGQADAHIKEPVILLTDYSSP